MPLPASHFLSPKHVDHITSSHRHSPLHRRSAALPPTVVSGLPPLAINSTNTTPFSLSFFPSPIIFPPSSAASVLPTTTIFPATGRPQLPTVSHLPRSFPFRPVATSLFPCHPPVFPKPAPLIEPFWSPLLWATAGHCERRHHHHLWLTSPLPSWLTPTCPLAESSRP